MTASLSTPNATLSLWNSAFNSLDAELRDNLSSTRTHRRDILEALLREIETKKDLAIRKSWKFKRKNGDVVIVRDILEKTARWINRFRETGDIVAQYSPTHLSLPWAAFRFLLQVAVSEVQVFGAMVDDLQAIAQIVARYSEFERLYLQGTTPELKSMLTEALTRLYVDILTHLARLIKFFREKSLVRLLKSPFRGIDGEQMHKITAQEAEVLKLARLIDSDKLLSLEAAVTRLSVESNLYSQSLSEQNYNKIITWLSVLPYNSHHQFVSQSRLPGLGNWLLNHESYISWYNSSSSSMLLLHGIAGSGKSTLCSLVVESMQAATNNDSVVAPFGYFYCDNPDFERARCSPDDIMRSIVGQLSLDMTGSYKIRDFLHSEYERRLAKAKVNQLDLPRLGTQDCIRLILELAELDPLTIIIDAVDTIEEIGRQTLISALKTIVSESDNVVKVMITSRSNLCATIAHTADKQIQITSEEIQPDMAIFVNHLVDRAVSNKLLLEGDVSSDLRETLIKELLDGAGEMFLWVKLQVQRLCREKFEHDVIAALQDKLPQDLNQLYQKSLSHIIGMGTTTHNIAIKALSWILYMREPLTPPALLAAISQGEHSMILLSQFLAICIDFLVLDKNVNTIRFAHQSVKDFLERQELFTAEVAHGSLALACIEACSRGPLSMDGSEIPNDNFYVYATLYWPVHSRISMNIFVDENLADKLTNFIFDEDFDTTLSFSSWLTTIQRLITMLADDHAMKAALNSIPNTDTGYLFLISIFGFTALLRRLPGHMVDLNANQRDNYDSTLIYLAAKFGHSTVVSELAGHGADIHVRCGKYGSPLHAACFAGHLEVVKSLLELGASVHNGVMFEDALQAACRGGHDDVAVYLIESGFSINSEHDYDRALEGAALAGLVGVVERLQEPPFIVFKQDGPDKMMRKIRKAITGGQVGVIRQFVNQQTNRKESLPKDAIALATLHNHKNLINYFLDEDMDIEAEGIIGTPLRVACLLNSQSLARLLLLRGADINACGILGTALQAASAKGHTAVVKFIIGEGADVNQHGGFYGTALQAAAYHGRYSAVEVLLSAGADVYAGGYSKDAFHAAAEGGHQKVITLMLQKGYRYNLPWSFANSNSMPIPTPPYTKLMREASPGRVSTISNQGKTYQASENTLSITPSLIFELESVSQAVEDEIEVAQLKANHAQVSNYRAWSGDKDNYALKAASAAGHEDVVDVLLERDGVIGLSSYELSDAIKAATAEGHWPTIQLLLDHSARRQSVTSNIELVLKFSTESNRPDINGLVLGWASKYCTTDEIAKFKQQVATTIETRHEGPTGQNTHSTVPVSSGDHEEARAICDISGLDPCEFISTYEVHDRIWFCALHGEIAGMKTILDSPSFKRKQPPSAQGPFLLAASNGYTEIMKMLSPFWSNDLAIGTSAVTLRALVIACENGHIDTVRYLVQDLLVPTNIMAQDKPIKSGLKGGCEMSFPSPTLSDVANQPNQSQHASITEAIISPIQAALRGLVRVCLPGASTMYGTGRNATDEAKKVQQEEVIMFLLDNRSNPCDLGGQTVHPIQVAVKFCSSHVVERFITAGIDVNVTTNSPNALFVASGRELSAAPIIRMLLAAGAVIPEQLEQQDKLLEQSLRYFGKTSSRYSSYAPQGLHSSYLSRHESCYIPYDQLLSSLPNHASPSLEYVFEEGPGAVLFELLSRMPQIVAIDSRWATVLQMAALMNKGLFVDLLLSRGVALNTVESHYGTALQAAARCGNNEVVQKLLDAGAQVDLCGGHWQTALRAAIAGKHIDVIEILLIYGADANFEDGKKASDTPLQLGAKSGNRRIVKALLEHGADAVFDKPETSHPLILASAQGSAAMVQDLLIAGSPVNVHTQKRGWRGKVETEEATPIHAAAAKGHTELVKLLLSHGANIENRVENSGTPLGIAAAKCQIDVVRFLLLAGAIATDDSVLSSAVQGGSAEIVQELLAAGAEAGFVLELACRQKNLPVIEILLEKICDDETSDTAIDNAFAIQGLSESVLRLLLDYACPSMDVFVQICATGSAQSVGMVLDKGAININRQSEVSGDYPLQVAALYLQTETVRLLLSRGANPNCESTRHGTPLLTALEGCTAYRLCRLQSKSAEELANQLFTPSFRAHMSIDDQPDFDASYLARSPPYRCRHLSECEEIFQLLLAHGASIVDGSRPYGSSLHLSCLSGSETLVKLIVEAGADINATAGIFERPIFAAIYGGNPEILEQLLRAGAQIEYVHAEFWTPLQFASTLSDSACVRKLLEYGAEDTVLDDMGRTALTIAIQELRNTAKLFLKDKPKATLNVMLEFPDQLRIHEGDIIAATRYMYDREMELVRSLLNIAPGISISEETICTCLQTHWITSDAVALLMPRTNGIGVTPSMLKAVRNRSDLEELLKYRPVCRITPEILRSQGSPDCVEILQNFNLEAATSEENTFWTSGIENDHFNRSKRRKLKPRQTFEDPLQWSFNPRPD